MWKGGNAVLSPLVLPQIKQLNKRLAALRARVVTRRLRRLGDSDGR